MKIGIYGGSFNPVTKAHLEVMWAAAPYVDELWVMPVKSHPWDKSLAPYEHRWKMLELALPQVPRWHTNVSLVTGNNGPTVDVMNKLRHGHDDDEYMVVIGSDNAMKIKEWTDYKRLCLENRFIIVARTENMCIDSSLFHGSIIVLNKNCVHADCATYVRAYVLRKDWKQANKSSVPAVVKYIKKEGLYK